MNIKDLQQKWLNGELKDVLYTSTDENNDNIIIIAKSNGFEIHTAQKNGWIRLEEYMYDNNDNSWTYSETYTK